MKISFLKNQVHSYTFINLMLKPEEWMYTNMTWTHPDGSYHLRGLIVYQDWWRGESRFDFPAQEFKVVAYYCLEKMSYSSGVVS